jgi:hypothetical protein
MWEVCRAGSAPPEGQGSWWAGGYSCLMPGRCLSQWGRAPVVPHRAGARQGLMGGGSLKGRGPVTPRIAGVQQRLKGGGLGRGADILGSCGTSSRLGSNADGWWGSQWSWCDPMQLRGGYPAVCGSSAGLWPGTA